MPITGVKPPPPPDSLRCAFEGTYGPTTWAVIHWFQLASTGAATQAQLDTLVSSIFTQFGTAFVPSGAPSVLHLTKVLAKYRLQSGAGSMKSTHVADVSGGAGGDYDAAQVCRLYNWTTIDDRRGGKPRTYMPGVTDVWKQDQASFTGTVVTSLTALVNTYIANVKALTSGPLVAPQLVEMSFVTGKAYRAAAVTFEIDSGALNPVMATQRRRIDRVRPS